MWKCYQNTTGYFIAENGGWWGSFFLSVFLLSVSKALHYQSQRNNLEAGRGSISVKVISCRSDQYPFPEVLRKDFEVGLTLYTCSAVRGWSSGWSDLNFTSP